MSWEAGREDTPGTPSRMPGKERPILNRQRLLACLFLIGVVVAVYSNSLRAGFAQDSVSVILEDPRLRAASVDSVRQIIRENYWWPKGESGQYRPVTTFSYLFNYSILGNEDAPRGYHAINLLLHAGNTLLVFLLGLRVFREFLPALATASLWAVHPVCAEAVANIVGRADELAAGSVLATILLYLRSKKARGWRRAVWLTGMAATTTLGVFSKENAAIVVVLLPLYDLTFNLRPRPANTLRSGIPALGRYFSHAYVVLILPLLALACALSFMFQKDRPVQMPFVDNPIRGADFIAGRLTAIKVSGQYLWLLIWPRNLSCDYSFNQVPLVNWPMRRPEDWQALAGLAALLLILAVAAACWRRNRPAFFWIAFALLAMLPTSNFLLPIGSIMAERFLYLPSVGFAASVVVVIHTLVRRFGIAARWFVISVAVIAVALGFRTVQRNRDWTDNETLWSSALAVAPDSFRPHHALAQVWFEREGPSERVLHQAEQAVAILNTLPDRLNIAAPYQSLGFYYFSKGEALSQRDRERPEFPTPDSREWYLKSLAVLQRAVPIDRDFNSAMRRAITIRQKVSETPPTLGLARLYSDLGLVYLRLNSPADAVAAYLYQRKITPANPTVYRFLAGAYLKNGNAQAAVVSLWGAFALAGAETTPYLLRLYDDQYPESCATYFHEGQEFLNTNCPLVQGHICGALLDVVAAHTEAGQAHRAAEFLQSPAFRSCRGEPLGRR